MPREVSKKRKLHRRFMSGNKKFTLLRKLGQREKVRSKNRARRRNNGQI